AQTSAAKARTSSSIKIARSESLQLKKGSAQYFTGSVQVEQLFPANDPSRTSGGKVTFEAGARSAWHTHPFGQILIVTEGTGWIQHQPNCSNHSSVSTVVLPNRSFHRDVPKRQELHAGLQTYSSKVSQNHHWTWTSMQSWAYS